jgi:hypothetical protein
MLRTICVGPPGSFGPPLRPLGALAVVFAQGVRIVHAMLANVPFRAILALSKQSVAHLPVTVKFATVLGFAALETSFQFASHRQKTLRSRLGLAVMKGTLSSKSS